MQLKYRLPLAIFATVAIAVSFVRAQDDEEDEEEEFGSFGFYARSPQAVSMALNLTNGPKVNFGNLGNLTIAANYNAAGLTSRQYDDGTVDKDARRPYNAADPAKSEIDSADHPIYSIGGRYKTYTTPGDPTSAVATNYLAYQEGLTRSWSYNNASQALEKPGYIAFHLYSAHTRGESLGGSRGYTGGVQVAVAHDLTDARRRINLRLTASVTLTGINSEKIGQVNSTLQTQTDYFRHQDDASVTGVAPVLPNLSDGTAPVPLYSGPTFDTTVANLITETTSTLTQNPDESMHTDDSTPGQTVVVHGIWKVKGAYFTVKLGPEVSAMLTRNIGLRAGVGVAGSYVGTTYSVNETFTVEGTANPYAQRGGTETGTTNKALPGYYANVDATWTLNERTGLFAGFSYDNLGEYTQGVGGRTAKIDLSATAGVRGGLNIKF